MNEQLHISEESHFIHATYHCLFILVNLVQFFNIVQDYFLSTIYFNTMKQKKKKHTFMRAIIVSVSFFTTK